jgi:thiol-disulfide isomerase/thioredoxin
MALALFAITTVGGILFAQTATDIPQDYGTPLRIMIASGIDANGNLILSGTEQRKTKVPREVEHNGKKFTQEMTWDHPVTILGRQTIALKDVTIYDGEGKVLSLDQARQRLKEPTPVLLSMAGERVNPIYSKILSKDTLTFTFASFPEFKEIPDPARAARVAEEARRKGTITVGQKVADFSVQTLDGKTVSFSELQKDEKRTKMGVVVLSFWCSTCGSCRLDEHQLDKLAKDYAGRAAVFAIDCNVGETAEKITAFAKESGLTMPILLDARGRSADVFGAEVTTTTVVIDGEGVLRYCGRFRHDHHTFAEDALKAVLAGREVALKTTSHVGCLIMRKQ